MFIHKLKRETTRSECTFIRIKLLSWHKHKPSPDGSETGGWFFWFSASNGLSDLVAFTLVALGVGVRLRDALSDTFSKAPARPLLPSNGYMQRHCLIYTDADGVSGRFKENGLGAIVLYNSSNSESLIELWMCWGPSCEMTLRSAF